MVRPRPLLASVGFALVLAATGLRAEGLLLKGFALLDPGRRTVRVADLALSGGQVVPLDRAAGFRVVEGKGRFLLPAMWDLQTCLWGNESAQSYEVLYQELGIVPSLRAQLWYGVAHVATLNMGPTWVKREMHRAKALEFPAAELLYSGKTLVGAAAPGCVSITAADQFGPLLDEVRSSGGRMVNATFSGPGLPGLKGLNADLLAACLRQAHDRGLKVVVMLARWSDARAALKAGADALEGLPQDPVPDGLAKAMVAARCAYVPNLGACLELGRLLGQGPLLDDPFLAASVPPEIRHSFSDPAGLWSGWASGKYPPAARDKALRDLRVLADAGVPLLNATDAGWFAGAFQGYTTHSSQAWLERAGLDPWTRLRAATSNPAAFLGRRCGFEPGDPADFVGLDADPVRDTAALREITALIRDGESVERDALKPDLVRTRFKP